MSGVLNLSFIQILFAYIFVLFVLIVMKVRGIKKEKQLLIAGLRMALQLTLTGYVLLYIFNNPSPWFTIVIIILMETFAALTVFKRFRNQLSRDFKMVIVFSISVGTIVCLLYFLLVVIQITPWYNPQYFIPIAGMIIGNSMTGISIGVKSLLEGMTTRKEYVIEALTLGATQKMATKSILDSAFDEAISPTMNSMVGMGIVFLPGMMTGQILSGTLPTTAIAYQIAIMLGILGAVSSSVLLLIWLGCRTFFNKNVQLKDF